MKKNIWIKIVGLSFTISLIVGMVGGALTNEYLISYLFGQLSQRQEEELPIVKKVIEERVYVEESLTIDAIQKAQPSVVSIFSNTQSAKSLSEDVSVINGVILTTDGIVVSCNSQLVGQDTWYVKIKDNEIIPAKVVYRNTQYGIAYLQLNMQDKFYQVLPIAKDVVLGQKAIVLTDKLIKSALISNVSAKDFYEIDRNLGDKFKCSPVINLGGELVGLALINDKESDTTSILPAHILEELLAEEVVL